MSNPIIVALDVPSVEKALSLAEQVAPAVGAFKIGKRAVHQRWTRHRASAFAPRARAVFLDLKFHDIPNTVAKAVAAATRLDVQMITIHTSGGTRDDASCRSKSAQETAIAISAGPLR
jgi:orotidine-5'-phosphate decarboxylase